MSSLEITSNIFKIDSDIQSVYVFLSDFNRIGNLVNMAKHMGVESQVMNTGKMAEISEKVEDVRFSDDRCIIVLKDMGELAIVIQEKEEPKLIKMGTESVLPLEGTMWIQLLENGPYDTRLRLVLHAELNMMLKMMVKGKIEKAVNKVAEALSRVPYMILKGMP